MCTVIAQRLGMQEEIDAREIWRICASGPDREAFLVQWGLAQKEFKLSGGIDLQKDYSDYCE